MTVKDGSQESRWDRRQPGNERREDERVEQLHQGYATFTFKKATPVAFLEGSALGTYRASSLINLSPENPVETIKVSFSLQPSSPARCLVGLTAEAGKSSFCGAPSAMECGVSPVPI